MTVDYRTVPEEEAASIRETNTRGRPAPEWLAAIREGHMVALYSMTERDLGGYRARFKKEGRILHARTIDKTLYVWADKEK